MNKDNAHLYIPLLEALRDGQLEEQFQDGNWEPVVGNIIFSMDPSRYRRSPKWLEFWVNYNPATHDFSVPFHSKEDAEKFPLAGGRTIRVREVLES